MNKSGLVILVHKFGSCKFEVCWNGIYMYQVSSTVVAEIGFALISLLVLRNFFVAHQIETFFFFLFSIRSVPFNPSYQLYFWTVQTSTTSAVFYLHPKISHWF